MNKNYIHEVEVEIMRRLLAVLLLLASGVHCLDVYFDIYRIVIGWSFIVIAVAYMAYMACGYIALRIKTRS